MKPKPIDLDLVNSLYRYNPETGDLLSNKTGKPIRKIHRSNHGRVSGYRVILNGVGFMAHRVIWAIVNGDTDMVIDHEDGDVLNNRISNLRLATNQQNSANRIGKGYVKTANGFRTKVVFSGKTYYNGTFKHEIDAALAGAELLKTIKGEWARL